MVEADLPVILDEVAFPDGLAGGGEAKEADIAGHDPDVLAIGDGRGGRGVLLAVELVAVVDLGAPLLLAGLTVEGEEEDLVARLFAGATQLFGVVGGVDEAGLSGGHVDRLAPDDGGGGAPTGHFGFPADVFSFRPFDGETVGFGRMSNRLGTAPLRPVVILGESGGEAEEDEEKSSRYHKISLFFLGSSRTRLVLLAASALTRAGLRGGVQTWPFALYLPAGGLDGRAEEDGDGR